MSIEYDKTCFVIMPFGTKRVGPREIDFDAIYESIFEPAIRAVELPAPETGGLKPKRTDKDFFSGDIALEMFRYLEYSRMALADITGLNPNVFYELGHRHRVRESGTAIFRQTEAPIPFDINQIKAFPYDYSPETAAAEARALITQVLSESLEQNRPDSPVRRALAEQRAHGGLAETLLRQAEDAIRHQDPATAIQKYRLALADDPDNPLILLGLGLLLKNRGDWEEALECFTKASAVDARYAEAHREKGIAGNKLYRKTGEGPSGEDSLRTAVELNPQDFDAWASLGGVLKREHQLDEALDAYREAANISRGHAYPLLNALKLEAVLTGSFDLNDRARRQLRRAEKSRAAQANSTPPYDAPWSHFDLAEIRLYLDGEDAFLAALDDGLLVCDAAWQPRTFRDSLELLMEAGIALPGLASGIDQLNAAIEALE